VAESRLSFVTLAEQWSHVEAGLDPNWGDARLVLSVDDDARLDRAAALLGPANPGRAGRSLRFFMARRGAGIGPEGIRRMLRRLDTEGITGRLELVASDAAVPEPTISRRSLADAWDAALAVLPSDWSDLYCELELTSTDHLDPAALLVAPLNPSVHGGAMGFRYRCARSFGYGASPGMVRRCLERLGEAGIPGEVRIVQVLSDTHPVGTQGPVWHVGGKTV
jgi:hypothetical protein